VLSSLVDLEGVLHHVDDTLHPLNKVVGFVRWVSDARSEAGVATGVTATRSAAAREAAAARTGEVVVKELKQISTGLARMAAMLAGKTTPDRATMLHSELPISPTWRANYQGLRPGQIRKWATQAVCIIEGSRTKK
jgi:hypothetical protein